MTKDFRVAEPAAEGNSLLDAKGFCELLQTVAFRAVTDHGEPGQTALQKWRAARNARSQAFRGTKPPTKISSSLAPGSEMREPPEHREGPTRFPDKKQFVAIRGKFGIRLRRSDDDRLRVAIGGSGKRQKAIQIP